MTGYLKLARLSAWPLFSLTFMLTFAVDAHPETDWPYALVGFASLFLFAAFAFALNFYSDKDTDRYQDAEYTKDLDLRHQPLVTGEVTERGCVVFCTVTLIAAVALGFVVSALFGLLVVLSCIISGILYSHPWIRLKAKPVGDILCIAPLGVLLPAAGYLLGAGRMPSSLMMLFWFLVAATFYLATVVSDYQFDIRAGLHTSAVFFGPRGLLMGMVVSCLLSVVVSIFIFNSSHYFSGTRYFAVVAAGGLMLFTVVVWRSLRPLQRRVPVISSRGRWAFIAPGIISLVFLTYGFIKIFTPESLPWDLFSSASGLLQFLVVAQGIS
ncbi:MAG TPA: UbiA family prenyltransferase [Dehalococcoidia bacterium]|nr:UbiA family prenyltransferase [Dehalococcoidia bacterium]